MVELSVIVPTLAPREDVACAPIFERDGFDDYELLVQDEYGAAAARNAGIERAAADKLIFLDDDSYPAPGYLAAAARVLDEEAAVAGRILHPYDDVFARFTNYYDRGTEPRYVGQFVSCNMALRREVVDVVGGFDEAFVWGHEDSELAYRVKKAYDVYYDPDLLVRHPYAESVLELWRKHYRLETHRALYLERKNVPPAERYARALWRVVQPNAWVGESPTHTAVAVGQRLAATLGLVRGFVSAPRADAPRAE